MQAGITAGTVLAVIVPVMLALICLIAHIRTQYGNEDDDLFDSRYYAPPKEVVQSTHSDASTLPKKSISNSSGSKRSSNYSTAQMASPPDESRVAREHVTLVQSPPSYTGEVASAPPLQRVTSDSFSDSDDSAIDDDNSLVNVPSSMDGDYETNEPVDNQPVKFHNVLWEIPQKKKKRTSESVV